ncbi:MAG TPA: hypothetical protein VMU67_04690 [Steroidobacteraceae bacterium]|nr:hypothetical protein [Steroidobacteraceae bacterium]
MKEESAVRIIPLALLAAAACILGGCGLGETAMSAATQGVSEAEQAKQAKATEQKVQEQLDAAARAEAEQREAAEKQGE